MVDIRGVREAAADVRSLGGAEGLAGHIQTIAYGAPGSTTEHVVYDLALAVGLWCSDVADLLDAVADEEEALPPAPQASPEPRGEGGQEQTS